MKTALPTITVNITWKSSLADDARACSTGCPNFGAFEVEIPNSGVKPFRACEGDLALVISAMKDQVEANITKATNAHA